MKKYTIECNEQQARLIAEALELSSRMQCGQLGIHYMPPLSRQLSHLYKKDDFSDTQKAKDEIESRLSDIKKILWGIDSPGASYGIGYNSYADLQYEMYKIILSTFKKEREEKEGSEYRGNVHTGLPLKLTSVPFIKVSVTKEKGKEPKPIKNTTKHHDWEINAGSLKPVAFIRLSDGEVFSLYDKGKQTYMRDRRYGNEYTRDSLEDIRHFIPVFHDQDVDHMSDYIKRLKVADDDQHCKGCGMMKHVCLCSHDD